MHPELRRWLARVPPAFRLLLAGIALLVVPHLPRLPLWAALLVPALLLWRLAHDAGRVRLPPRWLLLPLTLGTLAGIGFSYHTLIGRDAGAAVLVFLLVAKLLEMHRPRDVYVVLFLGDFLLVIGFLFDQSMFHTFWNLVALAMLLGAQIRFARHEPDPDAPLGPDFQITARLLLQALPIALVLFLFFPRPEGPLWGMPEDALSARTGLSETLSPGRISQLSDDDAVAFRVAFDGPMPPPRRLYWRGLVHVRFDGRTWHAPRLPAAVDAEPDLEMRSMPITYTLTLEPHDRRWLFFLDAPLMLPANVVITADRQIAAKRPVRELMRYRASAVLDYRAPTARRPGSRYLAVPPDAAPRARLLVQKMRAENPDDRAMIGAVLDHFRTEPFYYSRRPPRLPDDPVDGFLFETRTGFCEHYASAFAVLMRLSGIPARLVSGYQGGEPNPLDDYLIVRQSDAHAWVEVWLPEAGWTRIDPTAVIPPDRILETPERQRPRLAGGTRVEVEAGWLRRGLRQAGFLLDMLDNRWNQWVLGFDRERQVALMRRLGLDPHDALQIGLLLAGLSLGAILILVLRTRRQERPRPDPLARLWQRFCRRLARRGLRPRPGETPLAFARRAAAAMGANTDEIEAIGRLYAALRYGKSPPPGGRGELAARIRRLRLR